MKYFSAAVVVTLALMADITAASNCKPGLNYCGKTLKKIGDYRDLLANVHYVLGAPWISEGDQALYECVRGAPWASYGVVRYIGQCPRTCIAGGSNEDDFCA
jgi:hypothetical protein